MHDTDLHLIFPFSCRNRRSRELSILEAIENGAKTLIDIVSNIYSEVDRSLWLPASSNVRLHVEHLAQQNKLPKVISAMFVLQIYFPSNSKYKHLYSMVLVSLCIHS